MSIFRMKAMERLISKFIKKVKEKRFKNSIRKKLEILPPKKLMRKFHNFIS